MEVRYARCCGVDVQQKTVVVCVLLTAADGMVQRTVRTFGTMTTDLLALNGWLNTQQVEQVALESTGVYWRPVFNLLEADHPIILLNAQHLKRVPGHKTDVKDSEWLADLLRHGLLQPSFIPPRPIGELRELTRYRKTLVQERQQQLNRLHKVLESANIKLGAVASDVLGVSGRDRLSALLRGEQDPETLAEVARGRLRAKLPALRLALEGRVTAPHRVLLRHILAHLDFLEDQRERLSAEIVAAQTPCAEAVALVQTLPGVAETAASAASAIIAEIGTDMTRFPSAAHLASWAGLCPGNKQSAGKRLSARPTPGNVWLRAVLGEVAWSITRTSGNYLVARYHHIARRRGKHKAMVAVAHSILVCIYHMLRDHQPYHNLGPDYLDPLNSARLQRHHVRRLEHLGYTVTLTPISLA
jgi:transposase